MDVLSETELTEAQKLINDKISSTYELKQIYGKGWIKITSPTEFGIRFKETVNRGMLERICIGKLKSNNHQTYEIG